MLLLLLLLLLLLHHLQYQQWNNLVLARCLQPLFLNSILIIRPQDFRKEFPLCLHLYLYLRHRQHQHRCLR